MRVIIQLLTSLEMGKKERRGRERKRGRKVGVRMRSHHAKEQEK